MGTQFLFTEVYDALLRVFFFDSYLLRFRKRQKLLKAAALHRNTGYTVIDKITDVFEFVLLRAIGEQHLLR